MTSSYYLSIDYHGVQIGRFSDFIDLQSYREVNGIGFISFSISADHLAIPDLVHLTKVSLWRKDTLIPYYLENYGFILSRKWSFHPTLGRILTCIAVHPNWILSTRIVAWKSGTIDRSKFTNQRVETIAKTLLLYNATGLALASAGRIRDGNYVAWDMNVEANAFRGPLIDYFCSYYNLLETLQKLSVIGVGAFDMVPYVAGYEFRWYDGQLGTDRSTTVFFAVEFGNIANPVYSLDNRTEETIAIVGGQGEGAARNVAVRQGSGYSITNDVEKFLYATYIVTTAGLESEGDRYLLNHKSISSFTFDVIQSYSCLYGLHYFLGDKISIRNPFTQLITPAFIVSSSISLLPFEPDNITISVSNNPWPTNYQPYIPTDEYVIPVPVPPTPRPSPVPPTPRPVPIPVPVIPPVPAPVIATRPWGRLPGPPPYVYGWLDVPPVYPFEYIETLAVSDKRKAYLAKQAKLAAKEKEIKYKRQ